MPGDFFKGVLKPLSATPQGGAMKGGGYVYSAIMQ